jgi:hypothetical protein
MAKEIILEDGRTALFDDDATEQQIVQKLQESGLRRRSEGTAAPAPAKPDVDLPGGPVIPAAASFVNSMAFGLPEMAARSMGGGEYIDAVRQQYPVATTAGDVAGMIPPFKMGMKAGQSLVGSLFKPSAKEAAEIAAKEAAEKAARKAAREAAEKEATEKIMLNRNPDEMKKIAQSVLTPPPAAPTTPNYGRMIQTGAQQAGGLATGVMTAQTQAASLGAARNPQNPGAGAQQGAQVFRNVATNLPGTQLIPGAQSTINAVTGVVPGVLGAGAAMSDYMSIDEMIRKEAAKRALQGSR